MLPKDFIRHIARATDNLPDQLARLQDNLEAVLLPLTKQDAVTRPVLLNGWIDYGDGYAPAAYWRDAFGIVHLSGIVKSGTIGVPIFNLPAGYRPAEIQPFTSMTQTGGVYIARQVDVLPSGDVQIPADTSPFIFLTGIHFRAEK